MAASPADPFPGASTTPPRPPHSSSSSSSTPNIVSFRRWLHLHRFHLMSALLASSTAVSVYRMYEQRRMQEQLEQQSGELDVELSKVQRYTERRRQTLQQQMHGLWAAPPTATATHTSSPSKPVAAGQSSGGWLSWSSWTRWWRGGSGNHSSSLALTSPSSASSPQLLLCGSPIQLQQLASLSATAQPSAAYMSSVVSDCDYLLHTGTLPPSSPFAASASTASPATPAASSSVVSSPPAADGSRPGQTVTGAVTGGGKRLLF